MCKFKILTDLLRRFPLTATPPRFQKKNLMPKLVSSQFRVGMKKIGGCLAPLVWEEIENGQTRQYINQKYIYYILQSTLQLLC
jgi:hypothetical protein